MKRKGRNNQEIPKKKKKKFSKFRFYFFNIVLGVIICLLVAAMAIYAFCTVHTVTVKGNTVYTEEEIKQLVLDGQEPHQAKDRYSFCVRDQGKDQGL